MLLLRLLLLLVLLVCGVGAVQGLGLLVPALKELHRGGARVGALLRVLLLMLVLLLLQQGLLQQSVTGKSRA